MMDIQATKGLTRRLIEAKKSTCNVCKDKEWIYKTYVKVDNDRMKLRLCRECFYMTDDQISKKILGEING